MSIFVVVVHVVLPWSFESLVHAYIMFYICLNFVHVDILKEVAMMVRCNVLVDCVKWSYSCSCLFVVLFVVLVVVIFLVFLLDLVLFWWHLYVVYQDLILCFMFCICLNLCMLTYGMRVCYSCWWSEMLLFYLLLMFVFFSCVHFQESLVHHAWILYRFTYLVVLYSVYNTFLLSMFRVVLSNCCFIVLLVRISIPPDGMKKAQWEPDEETYL